MKSSDVDGSDDGAALTAEPSDRPQVARRVRIAVRAPEREQPGRRARTHVAAVHARRYPGHTAGARQAMPRSEARVANSEPIFEELALSEIASEGSARSSFLALHAPWTERGLTRWLGLMRPEVERPVLVVGAVDPDSAALLGAVIGVWNAAPVQRFDDLLEPCKAPGATRATDRPAAGAWHLISVTTAERAEVRNLGLGRRLLTAILALLAATGHAHVCTMSPALGLPELMTVWPDGVDDAVLHAARADGRPALQVLRLHLGGGATLDRVLQDSRRDDHASGGINLRFCYATSPSERVAQKQRWQRWIASRAVDLKAVGADFLGAPLFRANPAHDALVCHHDGGTDEPSG